MIGPGSKLAHYEVVSALGKGGMGEVWRAKDTKLGREIAIKTLPAEFAQDADRLARFEREAKLLASLNHPNIAAIYGLEEHEGSRFLVLELVEGDTLADQIKRGAIHVEDSLKLALQIAEALEAAHEKGVIHRDLKPANIKVTPDGKVKVLDFGLAKAFASDEAGASLSNSPTLSMAATQQGMILCTAAYMSPEQASGSATDKRGDIWAFGVVLFEMLTGQAVFSGKTVSHLLGAVLQIDPDWDVLPADTPISVRRLLFRCLEKDPKRRLRDMGDARLEIEDASNADPIVPATKPVSISGKTVALWFVGGMLVAGLIFFAVRPTVNPLTGSLGRVVRFEVAHSDDQQILPWLGAPAVSPDGLTVAYTVTEGGTSRIVLRPTDAFEGRPVEGTEGGSFPFFSPDGEWIGFLASLDLYKVPIVGGRPIRVAEGVPYRPRATWGSDGRIVVSGTLSGLIGIPEDEGPVVELTIPDAELGEIAHSSPLVLPDGTILFDVRKEAGETQLARYSPRDDTWGLLDLQGAGPLSYLQSGHLLFQRDGTIFGVPFDMEAGRINGPPQRVLEDADAFHYAVSPSGTAAYLHFPTGSGSSLVRVDRTGRAEPLIEGRELQYRWPRLSPDGSRLAVGIANLDEGRVSVFDLQSGRRSLLRDDGIRNGEPVWSPDGISVAYSSSRSLGSDLYWQSSDGGGISQLLSDEPINQWPTSFSPDGMLLSFYGEATGGSNSDVYVLSLADETSTVVLDDPGQQRGARFSPGSNWLAYTSNHTGRSEVYMRPYPELDREITVSTDGGVEPSWSRDGSELFYRNGDQMIAVEIIADEASPLGEETILFEEPFQVDPAGDQSYDVFPDGQHFVMVQPNSEVEPRLRVVSGLVEELLELVPID